MPKFKSGKALNDGGYTRRYQSVKSTNLHSLEKPSNMTGIGIRGLGTTSPSRRPKGGGGTTPHACSNLKTASNLTTKYNTKTKYKGNKMYTKPKQTRKNYGTKTPKQRNNPNSNLNHWVSKHRYKTKPRKISSRFGTRSINRSSVRGDI
jgi:hypothetical protein